MKSVAIKSRGLAHVASTAFTSAVALASVASLVGAVGCSASDAKVSSSGAHDVASGTAVSISSDETWSSGKRISGQVMIEAGVTVTIEPGAAIDVASGAMITVAGKLVASSAASHATMGGAPWIGLVVAAGGSLALSGVELDDTRAALDVQGGTASFDDGVIAYPSTPFRVLAGATLSMARSNVVMAQGLARVKGTFIGTHLDFETIADSGLVVDDVAAKVSIEDSTLHGKGAPTDLVVVSAGAVHLAYTDISTAHCGLHFWNANQVDISNVTIHDTSFGAMLYGSQTLAQGGSLSIVSSNFERAADMGIEEVDGSSNGAIEVRGCYFGENTQDSRLQSGSHISIVDSVMAPVSAAKPR